VGVPIRVAPCITLNVTVPSFTPAPPEVTVASSVTFWADAEKPVEAFTAVVVVLPTTFKM
jgi:hypothetical protein